MLIAFYGKVQKPGHSHFVRLKRNLHSFELKLLNIRQFAKKKLLNILRVAIISYRPNRCLVLFPVQGYRFFLSFALAGIKNIYKSNITDFEKKE